MPSGTRFLTAGHLTTSGSLPPRKTQMRKPQRRFQSASSLIKSSFPCQLCPAFWRDDKQQPKATTPPEMRTSAEGRLPTPAWRSAELARQLHPRPPTTRLRVKGTAEAPPSTVRLNAISRKGNRGGAQQRGVGSRALAGAPALHKPDVRVVRRLGDTLPEKNHLDGSLEQPSSPAILLTGVVTGVVPGLKPPFLISGHGFSTL